MLERINHTTHCRIKLDHGYLWILLSNNIPCTNRFAKNTRISCWIYSDLSDFDKHRVQKLTFNNYSVFKKFKDTIKKNI